LNEEEKPNGQFHVFVPAQGEFHLLAGRPAEAGKCFEKAITPARSRSEASFFERKLEACRQGDDQINDD